MEKKAKWIDLAVKPHFSWPDKIVQFAFDNKKIVLQPRTEKLSCTVSVYSDDGLSFEEGGEIIFNFLSRLAWSQNEGIVEHFISGSNNPQMPGLLGKGTYGQSGYSQTEPWNYVYLPSPKNRKGELALAVFREAMSLNSIPFAFLSFFKVINIPFEKGNKQKTWINSVLNEISYSPALKRLQELEECEPNVGSYLYHQGRCAVAHAFDKKIINPDSYLDKRRLEKDLPVIKELASICIEKILEIKTESSFWQHLKNTKGAPSELYKKSIKDDGSIIYLPLNEA